MGDEWLARDKAQHLMACAGITIALGSALALSSRFRAWRIQIASLASLAAGGAKEALDELHWVWRSSGASGKDAIADVLGVAVGAGVLWVWPNLSSFCKPFPFRKSRAAAADSESADGDNAV